MCHHPLKASLKNFLKRCVETKSHDLHQFVAGLFDPDIQCATCAGVSCMLASNGTCSVQPVTKLRTHQMLQFFVKLHEHSKCTCRLSENHQSEASDSTQNLPGTSVLSLISLQCFFFPLSQYNVIQGNVHSFWSS